MTITGGQGSQPLARASQELATRSLFRGRGDHQHRQQIAGPEPVLPARRPRAFGQQCENREDARPRAHRRPADPALEHHHRAGRPAALRGAAWMTPRAKHAGAPLFAAAGLERDAPRPLADKLRPTRLGEVVGQDHLLRSDGALTRPPDTRTLGPPLFWGPPGPGKTTDARLLAQATEPHFEHIPAIL